MYRLLHQNGTYHVQTFTRYVDAFNFRATLGAAWRIVG